MGRMVTASGRHIVALPFIRAGGLEKLHVLWALLIDRKLCKRSEADDKVRLGEVSGLS